MSVTTRDVILLGHAAVGVVGTLSALWVFVEALNAREENAGRIRAGAWLAAGCMLVTWALGGYWYLHWYPPDKALVLKGPWPAAHEVVMETKEHLFLVTLILSLYLAIAARGKLYASSGARKLVLCVSLLVVVTGLAIEGFGAIVNHGVEVALRLDGNGTR